MPPAVAAPTGHGDGDEIIVFMRGDSDVCFFHGVSCWLYVFTYADRPGSPGSLRYPRRHATIALGGG